MFRSWVLRRWADIEPAWIEFLLFGSCSLHFWSRSCSPDSDIEPVSLSICDIDRCSCFLAVSIPQWFLNFWWLLNLFMMWILFSAFWYRSCSLHFWGGSCSCVLAVRVLPVISEPLLITEIVHCAWWCVCGFLMFQGVFEIGWRKPAESFGGLGHQIWSG